MGYLHEGPLYEKFDYMAKQIQKLCITFILQNVDAQGNCWSPGYTMEVFILHVQRSLHSQLHCPATASSLASQRIISEIRLQNKK